MSKQSKSKGSGGSKDEAEKRRSATPSTNAGHPSNTSATSGSSQNPKSQIGFQPTESLDIDDVSASLNIIIAFAGKLGDRVFWRRVELADGQEVIALCFPLTRWGIASNGTLKERK